MNMMKEMALWSTAVNFVRNDSLCNWGVDSQEGLKVWEDDINDLMYSIFGVGWANPERWKKGA